MSTPTPTESNCVIELAENSSLFFVVKQKSEHIIKSPSRPAVPSNCNFMVREYKTKKFCGDRDYLQKIRFYCQNYVKCECEQGKCPHAEVDLYPYNKLASKILNYLESAVTYFYWVSGDCYIEFDSVHMTPEQIELFVLGHEKYRVNATQSPTEKPDTKPQEESRGIKLSCEASSEFIILKDEQSIRIYDNATISSKFAEFKISSYKTVGENSTKIVIKCQHYDICSCNNNKDCFHRKTDNYPYNELASKIVNGLENSKSQKYWISGDCYLALKDCGTITPTQLKLMALGFNENSQ